MWRQAAILLCLTLVLGMAGTASAALIAHWPLDGDAQDVADSHHGTLVGGAAFVEDAERGKVLRVDGVDGHVAVPHAKDLEFSTTSSYTIMAWAYIEAVTGAWQGIIAESRDQGDHYGIWVTDTGDWMGGGWENRGSKVPTKVWVHVAYVQNGATGAATTYVNGVADWSGGTRNGTGLGDFWIGGAQLPPGEGPPHEMFGGMIDDVRVYNHALTAAEVKAMIPPKLKAYNPVPADGTTGVTAPLLQWTKGDTALFHNVYLGTSPDLTEANRVASLQPFTVYYHMQGFTPGTTYYWRVDEVEVNKTTIHTGKVWSFTVTPLTAYAPAPADGSEDAAQAPILTWLGGQNAVQHRVYFGDSFDDVKAGTAGTDRGTLTELEFSAGLLRAGTTYYWRVDETDAADRIQVGTVWSFTTGNPVEGKVLREWWSGINGTNVSDLTADPRYPSSPSGRELLSRFEGPVDWANNYGSRLSGWLVPPKSGEYTFWIASDDGSELWLSTDADPAHATVIAGVAGWTDSQDWENMPAQKSAPVTLQAGQKYYIQALQKEGSGGDNVAVAWQPPGGARDVIAGTHVRTYALPPIQAATPFPANGAVDTIQSPILSWFPGEKAQQHQVYLGQDADAVASADTSTAGVYQGQQAGTTFDAGDREWGKTYYWRIDEINASEPDSPWKGSVWSFTTADFILIDDFEAYNDDEGTGTRIYETWIDGYTDQSSGSTVGNLNPPFAERTIIHGGQQAMPMDYNNVIPPYYSEAERVWDGPQDWTVNGIDTLTLYMRGRLSNTAAMLYVALEDSGGKTGTVSYGDDTAVQSEQWLEWKIPLSRFTGVNAAKVKKMRIGMGDQANPQQGGTGRIYVDDIRVTMPLSGQ
jgi:hypothetical protein